MEQEVRTCITCSNLPGCRLLLTRKKRRQVFDPSKLITIASPRECDQWEPAGNAELGARKTLLGLGAEVAKAVEAIYNRGASVDDPPMDEELLEEGEILLAEDIPKDLTEIRPGITVEEREQQLRYVHSEGEPVLDEEGRLIPRSRFEIATYAVRPEFPVRLEASDVLMWKTDVLVEAVLRRERDLGLWDGPEEDKKNMATLKRSKNIKPKATPTEAEAPQEGAEEPKAGPATKKKRIVKKAALKGGAATKAKGKRAPVEDIQEEVGTVDMGNTGGASQVDISGLEGRLDAFFQEMRDDRQAQAKRIQELEERLLVATTLAHDAVLQVLMVMSNHLEVTHVDEDGDEVPFCPQGEDGPMVDGLSLYTPDDPQTVLSYLEDSQGE